MTLSRRSDIKIDCRYCPIRHRAVCARAEAHELEELNDIKHYASYSAGQTIALQGDRLEFVASVVSGVARLSKSTADGRTQTAGLLMQSDFMGRPGREEIGHDIEAVTDVTLCCFERKKFEKLLHEMPHVQERLLEMTMDELDAARDWLLLLGRKTAREKIASFLGLILKRVSGDDETVDQFELPLSREMMASHLGVTLETVSRQISALKKDGIIALDGTRTVHVLDAARLTREMGD